MAVEVERKFRVAGAGWRDAVARSSLLRQGYLAQSDTCSVRVRVVDDMAWLNIKGALLGATRPEYEYAVPQLDAAEMLRSLRVGPMIEKWRHIVPFAGHHWEVDEFLGDNAGLVIAEIELDAVDEAFARPPWLGVEVTDDSRFYNSSLVRQPWSQLRTILGERNESGETP